MKGVYWVLASCLTWVFFVVWIISDESESKGSVTYSFIESTPSKHPFYPKPWVQANFTAQKQGTACLRVITEGIESITLDSRVTGVFYTGKLERSSYENNFTGCQYREYAEKNITNYMGLRKDTLQDEWATLKLKTPEDTTQRTHVVIGCKGLKKLRVQTMGRNEKGCSKAQEIVVNTPYPLTLDYLGIKSMRAPHRYPYELDVNAKAVKMIQKSSSLTKIAIRGKIDDFYGEIMVVHPFDLTNATIKSCILLERFPMPETITEKKIFVGKIHHLFYMGTKDNVDLKYPIPYVRKEIRAYEDIQKPIYL